MAQTGKIFDDLEQCFEAQNINIIEAREALDHFNSLFPPNVKEEIDEVFNYIIYFAVYHENMDIMKLIYHPAFEGRLKENIQTHVAHEVVEQEKYDFIVPTVLGGVATMENYTFEVVNLGNLALCEYILTHPPLDLDSIYLKEIYKNLFYQEGHEIAYLLKDKVNMDNEMAKKCFKESLTLETPENIEYLMQQYPQQTLTVIANWFYYIQNDTNQFEFDENNLLYNEDFMGPVSLDVITYIVDLFEQHNNREMDEKEEFLMSKYFLKPLMERENGHSEKMMLFLDHLYGNKGKKVSKELISHIEEFRDRQYKTPFADFSITYEKHCLEILTTAKDTLVSHKKMKL